ncbi:MAG: nickel pincer cofactor biosynthesis protein LarB [Candidatus Nezhaarchaeales archaeon]
MSLREIIRKLVNGELSIKQAEALLKMSTVEKVLNVARLDVKREVRKEVPEVILAEGKRVEDLLNIVTSMVKRSGRAIVSRLSKRQLKSLVKRLSNSFELQVSELARVCVVKKPGIPKPKPAGKIGILTAGTADVPVAEEARIVAEEMGCEVYTAYDVGVAGLHRLKEPIKSMIEKDVDVFVVIAGREGALPTVVASLVDVPVIGVPTSTGYGFGGRGIGALASMLQSCSLGIAVVNIDGGIAAGVVAALIAKRVKYRSEIAD